MQLKVILLILCCLIYGSIRSQPEDATAKIGIQSLDFKVGEWTWEVKGLTVPGDPKMYQGKGTSHVYYVNDSTALIDDHRIAWENGLIYRAITYRTFDETIGKYLVVWAQANSNLSTTISGKWEGDHFVEVNAGTDAYGKWTNRLEIYDIQANTHRAKLVRTYDNGYTLNILEYKATRNLKHK